MRVEDLTPTLRESDWADLPRSPKFASSPEAIRFRELVGNSNVWG